MSGDEAADESAGQSPPAVAEPAAEENAPEAVADAANATMEDLFGSDDSDDEVAPAPEDQPEEAAKENATKDPTMEDLFGSDDDDDQDAAAKTNNPSMHDLFGSDSDNDVPAAMEDAEMAMDMDDGLEAEAEPVSEQLIECPQLPRPTSSKLNVMRMPQFLGVKTEPFDGDKWTEEEDANAGNDAEIPVGHENIIRWRWGVGSDGVPVKQSNARMVEWSDGSKQLMIGEEFVDLIVEDAGANTQLWGQVPGQPLLECHGLIHKKLIIKSGGNKSKAHKKLSAVLERRLGSTTREAKQLIIHHDTEAEHEKKERERDELLRSRELLVAKQDKMRKEYDAEGGWNLEDRQQERRDDHFGKQRVNKREKQSASGSSSSSKSSSSSDSKDKPALEDKAADSDNQAEPSEPAAEAEPQVSESDDDDGVGVGAKGRKRQRIVDDDESDE